EAVVEVESPLVVGPEGSVVLTSAAVAFVACVELLAFVLVVSSWSSSFGAALSLSDGVFPLAVSSAVESPPPRVPSVVVPPVQEVMAHVQNTTLPSAVETEERLPIRGRESVLPEFGVRCIVTFLMPTTNMSRAHDGGPTSRYERVAIANIDVRDGELDARF